jgi:N utilization substance protein A
MSTNLLESLGISIEDIFAPRVVTATVTSASADVAVLRTLGIEGSPSLEAVLPATEWYPTRRWELGATYQLLQIDKGPRPLLSAVRNELIEQLFAGVSPEVRSGAVRIMGIARNPGVRTKVAVAACENGVDPIAACVGRRASRVRLISSILLGERLDVVAWHPDQADFLRSALAPAAVSRIEIDGEEARAYAPAHQMSAAVGGAGQNSQLAGQLVGLRVTVVPD